MLPEEIFEEKEPEDKIDSDEKNNDEDDDQPITLRTLFHSIIKVLPLHKHPYSVFK